MNKINIHISPKFLRLLTVLLFLLSSNILYSQYAYCNYNSPCPPLPTTNTYELSGQKWNKSVLKYYFINGTVDITGDGEKTAFETAFNTWSAVVPLKFEEVFSENQADIKIHYLDLAGFLSTGASSSSRAVTYIVGVSDCAATIVVNDNFTFSLQQGQNTDLVYVAIHEVGHVLGLCHTNNSATIMHYDWSPKRSLHSYDIQGIQLIYPSISVTAQNNFDGGSIYVNSLSTAKTAPYDLEIETGDKVEVSLGAIEQNDGIYDRIWNDIEAPTNLSEWEKIQDGIRSYVRSTQNFTFNAKQDDNNSTYEAGLRKVFNISFRNQFSGTSYGGQIKVNGTWKNAPTAQFPTVEQNLITAEAKAAYENVNGITYLFQKWDDNNSARVRNLYPNSHNSLKAIYKGYPVFDDSPYTGGNLRDLSFSSDRSSGNIKLTWDDHPNNYVTKYYIYRYYKQGPKGLPSPAQKIATLNRGTTTYVDNEFKYNSSSGDYYIYYDVRAYYSLDGTTSASAYRAVTGDQDIAQKIGADEKITTYDISNYPNPYNPQTTIRFQLPQEGFVTIKVYDSIGREVKTLLNEQKGVGIYELKFDGSDLPSGMYIYTIKANDFYNSKKMLLIK